MLISIHLGFNSFELLRSLGAELRLIGVSFLGRATLLCCESSALTISKDGWGYVTTRVGIRNDAGRHT
jgi:hypothetical protein